MIELCAVGDISPGDHYFLAGCGVGSTFNKRGGEFLFNNIKPVISGSDIIFGNLEGVLSNHGLNISDIESTAFRGAPEMALSLRNTGFGILNVANNHILQHGREAFNDTVLSLKQNRIIPLGLASSNSFSSDPVFLERSGYKIGLLGYSLVPENYYPDEKLYARGPVGQICSDISKLSQDVDFAIVSIHHGLEGMNRPSPYGAMLSRKLIDAGARVVLGHHSHVFQPVEKHKNGIICHSLGDFLFDLMWYAPLTYSAVVKICLTRHKSEFEIHPFRINRHFQPTPLEGEEETLYQSRFNCLNNPILVEDYEIDSYKYYTELKALERHLARKKALFFVRNLHKGRFPLKIQFILRKMMARIHRKS